MKTQKEAVAAISARWGEVLDWTLKTVSVLCSSHGNRGHQKCPSGALLGQSSLVGLGRAARGSGTVSSERSHAAASLAGKALKYLLQT